MKKWKIEKKWKNWENKLKKWKIEKKLKKVKTDIKIVKNYEKDENL